MSMFSNADIIGDGIVLGGNSAPTIAASGALSRLGLTARNETRIIPGMPSTTALIQQGATFSYASDGAIATNAAALPTTTASHQVTNNFPVGGKHMVFDNIGFVCDGDTYNTASRFQMIFQMQAANAPVTATIDTLSAVKNLLTGQKYLVYPNAIFSHTVTLGGNEVWSPLGPNFVTSLIAEIGFGIYYQCQGEIVLPPQKSMAFNVVTPSAALTGYMFYAWHEVQLQ